MKKVVREILEAIVNCESEEEENTILYTIGKAFEDEKIIWKDHELLIGILYKEKQY